MKNKFWVVKYVDCVPSFNDLPDDLRQYGFLHQFDFEAIVRDIIELMRYRTTVKVQYLFESEIYYNILKQTKLHLHSNERTVKVVRDFLNTIVDYIDQTFIDLISNILMLDTYDLETDNDNLLLTTK